MFFPLSVAYSVQKRAGTTSAVTVYVKRVDTFHLTLAVSCNDTCGQQGDPGGKLRIAVKRLNLHARRPQLTSYPLVWPGLVTTSASLKGVCFVLWFAELSTMSARVQAGWRTTTTTAALA